MASASVSNNSREYCLRWNNWSPNMATYFGNLYNSESLVDVTLVSAEGSKVLAHKLVLSACSPYFQHIFASNPCKHPVVILKDVQHCDLEAIIKFIYNGEVNISQDRMTPILKTANSLQVKGLAEVPAEELKRVSSVVGSDPSSGNRAHKTPPLASSLSWDTSDSAHDIPKKKLKKSSSTTTSSYISGSLNTNGDHFASIDSGVGASVSKSMDESGPGDESPPTVLQKRIPVPPVPPSLLPKSRSLDLHRDLHEDHEMNTSLSEHHQRQSYDDSSVGLEQGYDLEVTEEMKLEGDEYDDGEIEYYEENEEYYDEEEDSYTSYEDPSSSDIHQSVNCKPPMPTLKPSRTQSATENANHVRELLHTSSIRFSNGPVFRRRSERTVMDPGRLELAMEFLRQGATYREAAAKYDSTISDGERRRRGRPLIRQPRIKRSDNEPNAGLRDHLGSELSSRDTLGGDDDSNDSDGGRETSFERGVTREISPQRSSIHSSSNLPIVRVSQSSPTPPSSPLLHPSSSPVHREEEHQLPVIVSTMSISTGSLGGYTTPPSCSTIVITPTLHQHNSNNTLLKVPSTDSLTPCTSSLSSVSGGSHLVKQISQPSLPSQKTLIPTGFNYGNAVIRRQNSTPATVQQSRIVQPLSKQGTPMFQIIQPNPERASSEDNSSKTFIIDLMPLTKDVDTLPKRELKKDGSVEQSGSFSRDDSTSEDIGGSSTNSSSFDDGLPVNRSGHCPALRPGPALGCNFCWNSVDNCGRILRRKTKYHCPECHINLCLVPCHTQYHEALEQKTVNRNQQDRNKFKKVLKK